VASAAAGSFCYPSAASRALDQRNVTLQIGKAHSGTGLARTEKLAGAANDRPAAISNPSLFRR
jgi:hypothetical protein